MMQIHGLKRLHVNVSLCQAYRGMFYVFFFSFLLYIKRTRMERKIVHSMYGVGVINRLYITEESKIRYNRSVMMKTKQRLSQLVLFTGRLRMVVGTLEKSDPQTGETDFVPRHYHAQPFGHKRQGIANVKIYTLLLANDCGRKHRIF